mmetsp:Transcript_24866/g.81378  ORF Transcript_24866/g.81378 Transcript_24866/m.81378 type:complete len:327 (-) Transcript_24866:803-1783(-)
MHTWYPSQTLRTSGWSSSYTSCCVVDGPKMRSYLNAFGGCGRPPGPSCWYTTTSVSPGSASTASLSSTAHGLTRQNTRIAPFKSCTSLYSRRFSSTTNLYWFTQCASRLDCSHIALTLLSSTAAVCDCSNAMSATCRRVSRRASRRALISPYAPRSFAAPSASMPKENDEDEGGGGEEEVEEEAPEPDPDRCGCCGGGGAALSSAISASSCSHCTLRRPSRRCASVSWSRCRTSSFSLMSNRRSYSCVIFERTPSSIGVTTCSSVCGDSWSGLTASGAEIAALGDEKESSLVFVGPPESSAEAAVDCDADSPSPPRVASCTSPSAN